VDFPDEFDAVMVFDLPLDIHGNLHDVEIRAVAVRCSVSFLTHLHELLRWLLVLFSWSGA
jgi:hypothetical protein